MAAPLADRVRPRTLDDVVGQERWIGPGSPLRVALEAGRLPSLVLWGTPGCGKTTLARILAEQAGARFVQLSAVLDGVKQLREVITTAAAPAPLDPRPVVLFVDEIHRWNKAQQDALLPHVEAGTVTLLGATTENPSFSLNPALRSRLRIIDLDSLDDEAILRVLHRALEHPDANLTAEMDDEVLPALAMAAAGDARRALGDLEVSLATLPEGRRLTLDHVKLAIQKSNLRHDRSGDAHYDVTSALIKSMRGSDPDASLYWLARMLAAGEDPRFIARRLVIFASEDVGNADPRALLLATAAADSARHIGMPEVRIPLAQAVTWLACAPKSNAAYKAIDAALADVERHGSLPVPAHLRNRPPPSDKPDAVYRYPHDAPHRIVKQQYLPDRLRSASYYIPADHGDERTLRQRLDWWKKKLDES